MATIDMRTRACIFACRNDGETTAEVAERFQVSPAFVRRLLQRHRETGSLAPKTGPRGAKPRLAPEYDRLRQYNADHPDHTPAEVVAHLKLAVAAVTVWRAFQALGLTFKKKRSTPPNATARMSRPPARPGSRASPPRSRNA